MDRAKLLDETDIVSLITNIGAVDVRLQGVDYLKAMMARATTTLGFDFGLVSQPDPTDPAMVTTTVMVANGEPQDNFSYALRGTPCENVFGGSRVCIYPDAVHTLFPDDALLDEMGVRFYAGAPLLTQDEKPLGIFVFMHRAAREPSASINAVIEYLASRAAMEIVRETTMAEQRLLEEREQRQKRLTALGQVVSGVAHDFNNLLAGMQGHVDLLERKLVPTPVSQRHLDGINHLIRRAQSTTRTLLDFSVAETGRSGVAHLEMVLHELTEIVADSFPDNIALQLADVGDGCYVQMDEGHLHQVLLNLCTNARDAMPEGGTIGIRVLGTNDTRLQELVGFEAPASLGIEVSDTGSGIESTVLEQMFDPFFTTKPRDRGTGLGLTGVHQLLSAYGGSIFVDTEVGAGSRFTVVLRAADPVAAVSAPSNQTSASPDGVRILFAEDEESIAELTTELLEMEGFDVVHAPDGEAALETYRLSVREGGAVDLLITDVNMPGRDGFQLLSAIREDNPEMKVIVCSGDIFAPQLQALSNDANSAVVAKPYTVEQLLHAISDQLRSGSR